MITAEEARKLTKNRRVYGELLEEAENKIRAAIDAGAYVCEITIHNRADYTAMAMMADELAKHGYLVVEKDHRDIRENGPYFFTMYINWEHEGDE